jgi:hypothetical protein
MISNKDDDDDDDDDDEALVANGRDLIFKAC